MRNSLSNPILCRVGARLRSARPRSVRKASGVVIDVPGGKLFDVWFNTRGCRNDQMGRCSMCNYNKGFERDAAEMVLAVKEVLSSAPPHPKELLLSPSGSMLDPWEVPLEARRRIFSLASLTGCETFLCETRPETVSATALDEMAEVFRGTGTRLVVEMGLESATPQVLRFCINKGLELDTFRHALVLAADRNVQCYANVTVGNAFLSPGEAVADAKHAANWALGHGCSRVVLFPVHVKPFTVIHRLWELGLYEPVSLWALVDVLIALGPDLASRAEVAWFEPLPVPGPTPVLASPDTCPECRGRVVGCLRAYRATMDFECIREADAIVCSCRDRWQQRRDAKQQSSLMERIEQDYEVLCEDILGSGWWRAHGLAMLKRMLSEEPHVAR